MCQKIEVPHISTNIDFLSNIKDESKQLFCGKIVLFISVGINLADVVGRGVIGANRGAEEWGGVMQARIYQRDT